MILNFQSCYHFQMMWRSNRSNNIIELLEIQRTIFVLISIHKHCQNIRFHNLLSQILQHFLEIFKSNFILSFLKEKPKKLPHFLFGVIICDILPLQEGNELVFFNLTPSISVNFVDDVFGFGFIDFDFASVENFDNLIFGNTS